MAELMFPKSVQEKKKPKNMMRRTVLKPKKKYQYRPKKIEKTESVLQKDKTRCFLCGRKSQYGLNAIEEHHCIEGNGRRPVSEKYGLKVYLCGDSCHRNGIRSAHKCKETALMLKQLAQKKFEETHTREEWLAAFNKSYLED